MTLTSLIKSIQTRLSPVAGEFTLPEAERLLGFLLNCSRSKLYLDRKPSALSPELECRIETIIARRRAGEPLAYILGSAFFYHKEFLVTRDVLIPRPDTETLIEAVFKHESARNCRFLDIGTGSGCIAAALSDHNPGWRGVAIDLSRRALSIARTNCGPAVSLACVNIVSAIKKRSLFNFIVSNPPYIRTDEVFSLPPPVRDFEPHDALDGGVDGLDFYRLLGKITPPLLLPGGRIYCEIGYDQGISVPEIFSKCGWSDCKVTKDYAGHDRVVRAMVDRNIS